MKQVDNYWVDDNNNKWDCDLYPEKLANKFSKYMKGCIDCINCTLCKKCRNCVSCVNCKNCVNCHGCRDGYYCLNCADCKSCNRCQRCDNSLNCDDCIACYNCSNCKNCNNCYDCNICCNLSDCNNLNKKTKKMDKKLKFGRCNINKSPIGDDATMIYLGVENDNLCCLDIDINVCITLCHLPLKDRCVINSPNGVHIYFRLDGVDCIDIPKLPKGIDFYCKNSRYMVCPPTKGYEFKYGSFATIPTYTKEDLLSLINNLKTKK